MHGNRLTSRGQTIAQQNPWRFPSSRAKAPCSLSRINGLQTWTVVPQNLMALRGAGEKIDGLAILGFIGAIQSNDTSVR